LPDRSDPQQSGTAIGQMAGHSNATRRDPVCVFPVDADRYQAWIASLLRTIDRTLARFESRASCDP
jgi:hypothetical protein